LTSSSRASATLRFRLKPKTALRSAAPPLQRRPAFAGLAVGGNAGNVDSRDQSWFSELCRQFLRSCSKLFLPYMPHRSGMADSTFFAFLLPCFFTVIVQFSRCTRIFILKDSLSSNIPLLNNNQSLNRSEIWWR